jgi:nitroimidazol reductase NimA-like FMN-containing flavoprotein (pyridoxamine 5'-phosphate oxidase superfamily)
MTESKGLTTVSEKNLDGYGSPPIAWERALDRLEQEWLLQGPGGDGGPHTHWLATVRPDGRPHVVPIGAAWREGRFYFTAGAATRKSRNLADNPRCSITLAAAGLDIVLEGEAIRVKDEAKLNRAAETFAAGGWAPTVRDGAFYHEYSAPSAGPPPWDVYEFTPRTVFGFATGEPYGATRWRVEVRS